MFLNESSKVSAVLAANCSDQHQNVHKDVNDVHVKVQCTENILLRTD